jgi:hypothetical protein
VLAGTAFFLRLPAGVLADRWNRRAILIACDLGRALNAGLFAIALALGHFVFAHVLVVAFVEAALGVLAGLGAPVGPVLAGLLLGALGPSRAIVVYGCALLVLAFVASFSKGLRA